MNTENVKEKLKIKLKEIFQLENLDLDFGIYRIMKYEKEEIEKFIEKDLIEETKTQLNLLSEEERKSKEKELEELKSKLIELGVKDYQNNEKYQQKLKEIEQIKVSEDLERDIYKHILNFFSRYYDNGDFITQRRYGKDDKYLIPYNGEEAKLYWANYDQYYVKTTEFFKKYSFEVEDLKVNFRVVEAEEEKSNIKSQKKKFFLLNEKRHIELNNNILNIYFEYRGLTEKEKIKCGTRNVQKNINQEICKEITSFIEKEHKKNQNLLLLIQKQSQEGKSILEKKLYHYTRRNTSDYFIHKDLKKFLEQELDFYIKSEVVNIEDVSKLDVGELQKYSLKIKVVKNIAKKIIEFVSHIETFQKKLWEKKKFVLRTEYVITTDRVPEELHPEIWKNKEQKKEWKDLGFEIPTLASLRGTKSRSNLKLPIDTRYFSQEFKENLLEKLTNSPSSCMGEGKGKGLDDLLDGLLIKSENYQGLNLILNKYKEKVQTIYIDPPFNKEQNADYLYNVKYKDSTWISILENRLRLVKDKNLLSDRGSIFVRCDYNGNMYVRLMMNEVFGEENFRNELIISRSMQTRKAENKLLNKTDSLFFYFKTQDKGFLKILEVEKDHIKCFNETLNVLRNLIQNNSYEEIKTKLNETLWMPFLSLPGEQKKKPYREIFGIKLYPPKGRHWAFSQRNLGLAIESGIARLKCSKCGSVSTKETKGFKGKCLSCGANDFAGEIYSLFNQVNNNWTDIPGYQQDPNFQTKNSEILLKRVIESTSNKGDLVLDFFLGSGTTTAVAQKTGRKWLGVEMGEHFYTVVLPRMKKVLAYDKSGISKEKDVKEKYNPKNAGGFFKYHYIEQYEDALENIEFKKPQQEIKFDDYLLRYILDFETKDSQTFLNIDNMEDPFNYKLKIIEEYQQKEVNVDLGETYNYIIGLKVNKIKFLKNQEENNRQYLFITGERKNNKVLVIWRNRKNIDPEKDRNFIKKHFELEDFNEVHLNGDSILSHQNIIIIEAEFKKLLLPTQV